MCAGSEGDCVKICYQKLGVRNAWLPLLLLAMVPIGSACSLLPWWARVNEKGGANATNARLTIDHDAMQDGMFVGVAISGGGSRAANFGAAVLFELQDLGILEKVDVISSVSGGSIAAAHYALDGYPERAHPKISFDRRQIDERFARDFQWGWIGRWFNPWNIWRYWITAFDRSDIMSQVFEANLFHEATFAHLSKQRSDRPKVLINASNFVSGKKFVFSNEAFDRRESDLASYPVARAVMASGAFPGAFANVTLQDYGGAQEREKRQYVHLFDGGPIDNLGVGTLIKAIQNHVASVWNEAADPLYASGFPNGCLIISIDAYTKRVEPIKGEGHGRADLADTRPWYGFLVDTNAIEAMDDLLAVKRNEVLHEMGLDRENDDVFSSFPLFRLNLDDDETGTPTTNLLKTMEPVPAYGPGMPDRKTMQEALKGAASCRVWHISIAQMPTCEACALGRRVNRIGTGYYIDKKDQCALFEAARTLVQTMWTNPALRQAVLDNPPTSGPAPQISLTIHDKLQKLNSGEPVIMEEGGAKVCQITASSTVRR